MAKILDPRDYYITNKDIFEWRLRLKLELLDKRGYKSDLSGKKITSITGCHMHEGIVTRGMVPKSIWWHFLIFSEVNCFLLLPSEHIPLLPNREWCIKKAYSLYGREIVREWFLSLPFKVRPFILE